MAWDGLYRMWFLWNAHEDWYQPSGAGAGPASGRSTSCSSLSRCSARRSRWRAAEQAARVGRLPRRLHARARDAPRRGALRDAAPRRVPLAGRARARRSVASASRLTERHPCALEDRLALFAHRRDDPLELPPVDAHARAPGVLAKAPDLCIVASTVDALDDAAVPVDAELEPERATVPPVDQALEVREDAKTRKRPAVELADCAADRARFRRSRGRRVATAPSERPRRGRRAARSTTAAATTTRLLIARRRARGARTCSGRSRRGCRPPRRRTHARARPSPAGRAHRRRHAGSRARGARARPGGTTTPAVGAAHDARRLARVLGCGDHGPSDRQHAVEPARDDVSRKPAREPDDVDVGGRERLGEVLARLVAHEDDVVHLEQARELLQLFAPRPATDQDDSQSDRDRAGTSPPGSASRGPAHGRCSRSA